MFFQLNVFIVTLAFIKIGNTKIYNLNTTQQNNNAINSILQPIISSTIISSDIDDDKIVGGIKQPITSRKFQVAVLPGSYLCGGSLIRLRWVLTAAHCTKGFQPKNIKVRAGSNYYDSEGYIESVEKIFMHHNFNIFTMNNDIALLKLQNGFNASNSIGTITIASQIPLAGNLVKVSGYGALSSGGNIAPYLMSAELQITDFYKCNKQYSKILTNSMFCATVPKGKKDSCQGDSGGPLTYKNYLIGIVSWGFECATARYPGVYTKVPQYRKWINTIIKYS